MGFASAWLADNAIFPRLIEADPFAGTGIIVVIPAYGEGDISSTIKSLSECKVPPCRCEVIVVVNAPQNADKKSIEANRQTVLELKAWSSSEDCFFRLFHIDLGVSDIPRWGVGYARKAGMDEAVRRFDIIDLSQGVISSLDADCIVSENYFTGLYNQLYSDSKKCGCSITLINGRDDENLPSELLTAAEKYELGCRYILFGMHYAGFPWCFNTVGSAMAVKADTYVKSGGMNRREAGEDFWFIRKLLPSGGFFNTAGIIINHSVRISDRVPFGTGVSVNRFNDSQEKANTLCHPSLFDDLKTIWNAPEVLFKCSREAVEGFYLNLPAMVKEFMSQEMYVSNVIEISANTSSPESFKKRYYVRFDQLFGQRYINFILRTYNKKTDSIQACSTIAEKAGFKKTEISSYCSALSFFRDSEAWISCSPF